MKAIRLTTSEEFHSQSITILKLHSSVLQPNWRDLEIEPGLNVQVANITTKTITIPPRAVLCEV